MSNEAHPLMIIAWFSYSKNFWTKIVWILCIQLSSPMNYGYNKKEVELKYLENTIHALIWIIPIERNLYFTYQQRFSSDFQSNST